MKKEKKTGSILLIVCIVSAIVYCSSLVYSSYMVNRGHIDTLTGAYIYETFSLDTFNILLIMLCGSCFMVSIITGIASIVINIKKHHYVLVLIASLTIIALFLFDGLGPSVLDDYFGPPEEVRKLTNNCTEAKECSPIDDDVAICMYYNKELKCPISIIKDKLKVEKS